MCTYIAIIATILAMTLWCMDSAAALKCNGYRLESLLAGNLDKVVYTGRECAVGVLIFLVHH